MSEGPMWAALARIVADDDLPRIPRQARSRAKRDTLLAAALRLFGERGYEAVGVEDIATRAGTGVGTFYAYFRSKRQLLLVLMQRYLDVMLSLDLLAFDTTQEPSHLIATLLRRALAPDRAYAGLWRAWREAVLADRELATIDDQIAAGMQAYVVAFIDRADVLGEVRRDLDKQATASLINAIAWQLSQDHAPPEDAIVRAAAKMIYHALFVDPAGP